MTVDTIRLGWTVLSEAPPPGGTGLRTYPLTADAPAGSALAIDTAGISQLLLAADAPGPEEDIGVVLLRNRELETAQGQRMFVVLACLEPSLRDAFDRFLEAVLLACEARPDRHPGVVASEVLADWRSLLQSRRPGLGRRELAALLAELLTLEQVLDADPRRRVDVWIGPTAQRHDLRRGDHAVEVKSTLSHTDRRITVHGLDQLEVPPGGSLALAWWRLEAVPEGSLSVFGIADRLLDLGVSALELYGLMERAGSPPILRHVHEAERFEVRQRLWFPVDDTFPRLVPDVFVGGGPPDGVDEITYRVNLPSDEAALDEAAVDGVIARLAEAA